MVNIIKVGCRLIIYAFRTEQSPNPSCVASLKTATKSHDVVPVWIEIIVFAFWSSALSFSFSFFGFHAVQGVMWLLFMYCSWTVAVLVDFFIVNSTSVHCLGAHKFHFLTIFSLKMSLTTLFTHLKFILLQCFQFSVFSFSQINFIQTTRNLLS